MESSPESLSEIYVRYRKELLELYPPTEIRQFIVLLGEHILGWDRIKIHQNWTRSIGNTNTKEFLRILTELSAGKPIQYIISHTWFGEIKLYVKPGVLIPRPETEEVCRMVASYLHHTVRKGLTVLDIGTGSGCIAIWLKFYFPELRVIAIDSSSAALDLARYNAKSVGCQVDFVNLDFLNENLRANLPVADIIVSNPPYVPWSERSSMHTNVIDNEPAEAIFVPDENPLLFYKAIAQYARKSLHRSGLIFLEIHENQSAAMVEMFHAAGFEKVELHPDIHGKNRVMKIPMAYLRSDPSSV